jgi:RNA recognition motif-containing protein
MRPPVFKGNVIVSNLANHVTAGDLADLFDQFGLVLGAKIDRWHDRPGGSQGLVDLAPDTAVDKAIEALNGEVFESQKLTVKRVPKQEPRKPAAKSAPRAASPRAAAPPAAEPAPRVRERLAPATPTFDVPAAPPAAPARMRQVVVEYRAPTRRVAIPPRSPKAASDAS